MLLKKIYDNTIIYSSKDAIVVNEKRISYLPRNFKINAGAINESDK